MEEHELLIDDLYSAAWLPELWPRVLDRISGLADAHGAVFFAIGNGEPRWVGNATGSRVMEAYLEGGWQTRNRRAERAAALNHPGFLGDLDIFTMEEIARDPLYTEFFRGLGLGWCMGTTVFSPSGEILVLNVERRYEKGPMSRAALEALDPLRPHFARAALMASRLQLERAVTTTKALEMVGLPAAVIAPDGVALAVNSLFDSLGTHVVARAHGRIGLHARGADQLLQAAITELGRPGGGSIHSIPLPASEDAAPLIVHLVPVRREARDLFGRAMGIFVATPIMAGPNLPTALLQGLFDLSPAEARIAGLVGSGMTPEAAAKALGVGKETVRHHLKSVFAKTGTGRQAELVALLSGKVVPRTRA
ncbi:helix-turn-helix transcriptional regulator [Zavarzinia aquatilis]|uniref:HTH luxR-type domain-containing protein n=1 Tax=Zavarzinia aquatilis TaxID=2211142 RepID=A0A317EL39_9PROT|nr:helix-turn-helix transcriptional regulator [Zavarzinia aquatilis]PWR25925.1 hypothetical protein DKG74_02955 [Zavarzinia aquatilis]